MSDKVRVRTTFFPDRELEVTPQEELDLKRQGFLAEQDEKATAPAARAKGEKA